MRTLLHLLKYEGMEPIARRLGELVAAQVAALPALPEALTVVPVPLFGAKHRQRGFNQAALIAAAAVRAARRTGLAWRLDSQVLRRKRATESQAALTPRQRRENVRGAFFVPGSRRDPSYKEDAAAAPEPLAGRDILLVDDIYTTGATARAASLALLDGGATSVWVATAARAQRLEAVPMPVAVLPMEEDVASWS